jgi:pimeloyl-ACP methyl ester carboxylesterase
MADHADHCRLVMRHLGLEHAHIVGHSSSAVIALQLAVDSPDCADARPDGGGPAGSVHRDADRLPARIRPASCPSGIATATRLVPSTPSSEECSDWITETTSTMGFQARSTKRSPTRTPSFMQELPVLQRWSFTQEDAGRITQPVLAVLGENSAPAFPERRELLLSWLPNVEPFGLPDATHLLHVQKPRAMATGLTDFFERQARAGHRSSPGS